MWILFWHKFVLHFFAKISSVYAMKYPYFVNLFIIINIVLCSCFITKSFDFNNLIIKSHNMTFYSPFSVLTGWSFLYSLCLENLFLWQFGYFFVICLVSVCTPCIIYSFFNLLTKAVTPLYFCVRFLWNFLTNSFVMLLKIYVTF